MSRCRRGFLLSVRKMKKHQRDCDVLSQAIQCLETLLLVISTEISQVQAIAQLTDEEPSSLKLFLTPESLRDEMEYIYTRWYTLLQWQRRRWWTLSRTQIGRSTSIKAKTMMAVCQALLSATPAFCELFCYSLFNWPINNATLERIFHLILDSALYCVQNYCY